MKKFKRHFRIYLRNKHPAYITDEANNNFIFHKVSHSKRICGKNTFKIDDNPILGDYRPMYISKNRQQDKKNRFLKEKLKTKKELIFHILLLTKNKKLLPNRLLRPFMYLQGVYLLNQRNNNL